VNTISESKGSGRCAQNDNPKATARGIPLPPIGRVGRKRCYRAKAPDAFFSAAKLLIRQSEWRMTFAATTFARRAADGGLGMTANTDGRNAPGPRDFFCFGLRLRTGRGRPGLQAAGLKAAARRTDPSERVGQPQKRRKGRHGDPPGSPSRLPSFLLYPLSGTSRGQVGDKSGRLRASRR